MSFALAQYRQTRTETASPVQIVVQLYDGALKYLRAGQEAMERGDTSERSRVLNKAHAIVTELQATLNPDQAPEICEQLYSLYDFALHQIGRATLENEPAHLASALKVLGELREAWAQIAKDSG